TEEIPAGCTYPCKSTRPTVSDFDRRDLVTVKFRDGLRIRAVNGQVQDLSTAQSSVTSVEMAVLHSTFLVSWEQVHDAPEAAIEALRTLGEANTGQTLPDLNLQLFAHLAPGTDPETALDALNALACVEMALPVPLPVRPPVPPPLDIWQDE